MRIESTRDVPLSILHEFRDELSPDIEVVVEEGQVILLSDDPPSWVSLIAELDWWMKLLAGFAALYVAEIVREAAKESWRNRRKGFAAIRATGDLIRKLALGLYNLKCRLSSKTGLIVGLPGPREHFGTRLVLSGSDPDEIAGELSLFVHHLPALRDLIKAEILDQDRVAISLNLEILSDGSLAIWWHDKDTLEEKHRILPFESAI
jgi:hypothetical protein